MSLHLLLGLLLTLFPSLGVLSDVMLAHLVLLILATCPGVNQIRIYKEPAVTGEHYLHNCLYIIYIIVYILFTVILHSNLQII